MAVGTEGPIRMADLNFDYWNGRQPLDVGKSAFERVPAAARPRWAARALELVYLKSGLRLVEIERAITVATNPEDWGNAKDVFGTLRQSTLRLEAALWKSRKQRLSLCLHYLAENAAKVTYNSAGPRDGFDEDSGWWIAVCFGGCLDELNDPAFARSAWTAVGFDSRD